MIDKYTPRGYIVDMNDPVAKQLKRIRGQVDGVLAMYEQDRDCVEVVRQIIAVRNSLTSVGRELFSQSAQKCTSQRNSDELDRLLKEMFKYY